VSQDLRSASILSEPAAREPSTKSAVDDLVRLDIINALYWDLAVPRNSVDVVVERGHVTLTGKVERAHSKACAERDARAIADVAGVTNEIVVDGREAAAGSRSRVS
jgi:osmotically-inducible protein OsmY